MCILFFLIFPFIGQVLATSEMWSQTFGGGSTDGVQSVVETADGGFVIAGYSTSFHAPFWLIKTDSDGNMEWNKTYGENSRLQEATPLIIVSDGGFALAGGTQLIKTDELGNILWNQTYDGVVFSLVETSDGGYALAGQKSSDFWLAKTDSEGNMLWNKTFGGSAHDRAYSLVTTPDGGYALVGETFSFGTGYSDFWLIKTDSFGNLLWNQTYGEATSDTAYCIVVTPDGAFALAGASGMPPFFSFWLIKTDPDGHVLWNQTYGEGGGSEALSMVITSDGGFALTGPAFAMSVGGPDMWLVKTDAEGNLEWTKKYGGESLDRAESIIQASDGGFVLAGLTASYGMGGLDATLIKTDEYGIIPEFPSNIVLPLLLILTALATSQKKKLTKNNHQ